MEPDKLYDVPSTAGEMGRVSPWAVWKWLQNGRLKRTKVGSRTMVRGSDIQAFIDACNADPTPAPVAAPVPRKISKRGRRPAGANT
jgi:hypothetical protein